MTQTDAESNKRHARMFLEDVMNGRRFELVGEYLAHDADVHLAGSMTMTIVLAAFPDYQLSIEHIVADDDMVTALTTFTGTHHGALLGIEPTERGVTGRIAFTFRFIDERIAASWVEIEPWGLLQQLRDVPVPA